MAEPAASLTLEALILAGVRQLRVDSGGRSYFVTVSDGMQLDAEPGERDTLYQAPRWEEMTNPNESVLVSWDGRPVEAIRRWLYLHAARRGYSIRTRKERAGLRVWRL